MLQDTTLSFRAQGAETANIGALESRLPTDLSILARTLTLVDGHGASKATRIGSSTQMLLSGASFTFDLRNLPGLTGTVVFTKVKAYALINDGAGDTDSVTWGNAAANAWTAFLPGTSTRPQPSRSVAMEFSGDTNGWAVAAGNQNLKVINNGTNVVSVSLIALGED